MFISLSNIAEVNAMQVQPMSGGLISTSADVNYCNLSYSYWEYEWLTENWVKASQYTVTTSVTVESSTTLSATVSTIMKPDLSASFGITYGTSVSTSSEIGTEIPADSSRNSKLRFKALVRHYKAFRCLLWVSRSMDSQHFFRQFL